jgi:hypothetical protein
MRDISFKTRVRSVPPISGGIAALGYPLVLVVVSLGAGFRQGGDMSAFAATLAATVLFLIATPTAWVLSFDFIDVTRFTVLAFGIITSAPIWWVVGVAIARRSVKWVEWLRRYTLVCVLWTATNLVVIGLIAALVT